MKRYIRIIIYLMILIMISNLISCTNTSGQQSLPTSKNESLSSSQIQSQLSSESSILNISGKGDLWTDKKLKVAYISPGAAGNWYIPLKKDFENAAHDWNIQLYNYDAAGKREAQEGYIIELVEKGIDVIAISSVCLPGWNEEVFEMAKKNDIPIIFINLSADIRDDLWTSYIVNNWQKEGEMTGEWLIDYLEKKSKLDEKINIVELIGIKGQYSAQDWSKGFKEIIEKNEKIKIVESVEGDYTQHKGYEEMVNILSETTDIDVLYCHNDDMAMGAIQAIEEAGLVPGEDIIIVSILGTNAALEAIVDGKIACSVEASPFMGDLFMEACVRLANGEEIEREIHPVDRVFDITNAQAELDAREENGYGY